MIQINISSKLNQFSQYFLLKGIPKDIYADLYSVTCMQLYSSQGIIFLVSHRNSRCIFSHLLRMFFYESQLLRCKRKHTCLRANSFTQMISTSEWPSRLAGPVICITQSHMKWSADKPHTVSARMHYTTHAHSLISVCILHVEMHCTVSFLQSLSNREVNTHTLPQNGLQGYGLQYMVTF